ncbi:hypothetical protein Q3G72_013998 [Acer saccharum]|nr:hypothetical protein Q3G72_013998 [Acer saccharum]
MSEGLLFSQLERYKISIGFDYNWECPPKSSRTLRFKIKSNDNADGVISQLKGVKELELFGKHFDINEAIQQFHENVNAKNMQRLQKDNELEKAKQQLDEEVNVQSSIKDCEGSSSHHLEIRGDSM